MLQDGHLEKSLKGHGHWVNTLALSTEAALRTGAFDHTGSAPSEPKEAQAKALERWDQETCPGLRLEAECGAGPRNVCIFKWSLPNDTLGHLQVVGGTCSAVHCIGHPHVRVTS